MPWILRLRYEKEITFVEPQQDLMLGRILAETRVPPAGAGRDAQPRGDRRQAAALPDPADPAAELGPRRRQADRRAGVRLRRRRDPGRAGPRRWRSRPSSAWSSAATPRPRAPPTSSSSSWASARRRTRGSTPARWSCPPSGWRRSPRTWSPAGWRVEAEGKLIRPAGEFKLARHHRHRLVRARRRRRLRRPARQPARPAGRRPPRRDR